MTTTLRPKGESRERILVLGGAKVGKTTSYLSIARRCPDSHVYILDSDFAMDRMLEDEPLSNVTVKAIDSWTDYVEGVREVTAKMRPQDWLVIDFLSGAWDAVQAWYIEQRYGKSALDYFTQFELARKNKSQTALDGDTDWGVINKNHKALMNLIKRAPGHVFATTTARAIGDRDDPSLKSTFGLVGTRPEGQKHLSHDFHTLIVLKKNQKGEYLFTSVGDRQRTLVDSKPLNDFAMDYLVKVASWRPSAVTP